MPPKILSALAGTLAVTALALGVAQAAPVAFHQTGDHPAFVDGDSTGAAAARDAAERVFPFEAQDFAGLLATITSQGGTDVIAKLGGEGWFDGAVHASGTAWEWTQNRDAGIGFGYTQWQRDAPIYPGTGDDHALHHGGKWVAVGTRITRTETVAPDCAHTAAAQGERCTHCTAPTREVTEIRRMKFFIQYDTATYALPAELRPKTTHVPLPPLLPAMLLGVGGLLSIRRKRG